MAFPAPCPAAVVSTIGLNSTSPAMPWSTGGSIAGTIRAGSFSGYFACARTQAMAALPSAMASNPVALCRVFTRSSAPMATTPFPVKCFERGSNCFTVPPVKATEKQHDPRQWRRAIPREAFRVRVTPLKCDCTSQTQKRID